jgi:hypothetical protein
MFGLWVAVHIAGQEGVLGLGGDVFDLLRVIVGERRFCF